MSPSRRDRDDEDDKTQGGGVSMNPEDAIAGEGLFGSGRATLAEALYTEYDYNGTVTGKLPVVLLVKWERGEGKEKETYDQPFGIGRDWGVDKKGRLIPKNGQKGLPKNCNAMKHLLVPLFEACKEAGISAPPLADDPSVLEGIDVELERVEQEDRDFKKGRGDRDRDRGRAQRDDRGPKTILEVKEIFSAPWDKGNGKGKKKKDDDEDEEKPSRGSRGKKDDDDDEEEESPKGKSKDKGSDDAEEDAIEALIAVVEGGKVKMGDDLEEALEKHLKGKKGAGAIIDLASSKKFLEKEKGWTFDGKWVDAEEKPARGRR